MSCKCILQNPGQPVKKSIKNKRYNVPTKKGEKMKCLMKLQKTEEEWKAIIVTKNKGTKQKTVTNIIKYYSNYIKNHFECQWSKRANEKTEIVRVAQKNKT